MKMLVFSPYSQYFYQLEKGFHSTQNQFVLCTPLAFSQCNAQMAVSSKPKSFRKNLQKMF